MSLEALAWPRERAPQALEALARAAGFEARPVELPPSPPWLSGAEEETRRRWMHASAEWLGLELEDVDAPYSDVEAMLRDTAPGLIELPGGKGLLVVLGRRGERLRLLGPGIEEAWRPMREVRDALCRELEAGRDAQVEKVLAQVSLPPARREKVRAALLRQLLGFRRVGGCWLLRLPAGADVREQARRGGLFRLGGTLLLAYVGQSLALLGSWWLLGRGALEGRLDPGWMAAWALVLLTMLPLRLLAVWSGGQLAVSVGALLKRRLLVGALRMEPEEMRRQGAGQLLGRVLESVQVESLAVSGGLVALASAVELVLALLVLGAGAGGWVHGALLMGMLLVTGWMAARYHRSRRAWTLGRLGMTHDLVERMAGHRTRLVQEPRDRWHQGEDEALERYLTLSGQLDRRAIVLTALLPNAWLVLGLLGLAHAFVVGSGPSALAVALGGVMLAYGGLRRLTLGLTQVSGAWISWAQVRGIFQAATRADVGSPTVARASPPSAAGAAPTLLEASGLTFRYPGRPDPVLRDCSLRITPGQRLLLEGPSGGGKSTLGAMIAGLRVPDSGLLLVGGLDRRTLGLTGWRERVVAVPQFHENHVLSGTFSFNLLMGRGWPPDAEGMKEAEAICRELALGDLLDRMPAGLMQVVGETGWQLSHGERSRLFIARALLQHAELIVLDESFAALDPDTLRAAMACVQRRARTLLVIAHP